jgi:hypothetical protein
VNQLPTKAQRIVMIFGGLAVLLLAVLLVFDALSLELYFVLCLICFLVVAQMSGPFASRPRWRSRINTVIVVGIVVFVLIVIGKVLDILRIRIF